MNSIIGRCGLAAAALCGFWVAGCDSVKNVQDEPAAVLPTQTVVLEGRVYGLGIRRSVTVRNGTTDGAPSRVVQGFPGEPMGPRGRESLFSFGSFPEGTAYNIVVPAALTPYGKICVVNNGTGTLRYDANDVFGGAPRNIEVVCSDDPAVDRYDIRVAVPEAFRSAPGAKVTLLTEEGLYEADPKDPSDGDPDHVWFRDALIAMPETGVLPFQNIVKATTEEGSTPLLRLVNRCAVANHTWPSPAASVAGDVTNVAVGACKFTVGGADTASGGAVRYSRPIGVTADPPMGAGGVTLELRYPNGDPIPSGTGPTTEVTIASFGGSFTFPTSVSSGAECPAPRLGEAPIPCEVRGFYEVVVKQHPAGQRCIVGGSTVGSTSPLVGLNDLSVPIAATFSANSNFAGSANLYILDESIAKGTFPIGPANFTGLRVYCRNIPAAGRVLTGTYQMTQNGSLAWSPAFVARREYSHALTLFDDGTFLFGVHTAGDATNSIGASNHTEYGFYDWDPNNVGGGPATGPKLRFTIHADTNASTAATATLVSGLSSVEGPMLAGVTRVTTPTANACATSAASVRHQVLTNVVIGTGSPRTISGSFGPGGGPVGTAPDPNCATTTTVRGVVFTEIESISGQLTGPWVSQDQQRFWWYHGDSNLVFHAGVNGGYGNIQNNCIKLDNLTAPSGQYVVTVGGAALGCAPLGTLSAGAPQGSVAHSPAPLLQYRLPGWRGWLPGNQLSEGVSPSPVYFQIAPPGSFTSIANPAIFTPGSLGSTSWCATEILGLRDTLNGALVPELKPVYFCRNTAP